MLINECFRAAAVTLPIACFCLGNAVHSAVRPTSNVNLTDFQQELESVEAHTLQRHQRLTRVSVQFPGGSEEGYKAEEVEKALETSKQDLLKELDAKDLKGLRAYVEVYFPKAELAYLRGDGDVLLATKSSTEEVFQRLGALLGKLRSIERLALNLKFVSEPDEARFEIWPAGDEKASSPATSNQEILLYRGFYKYRVYKPGFKTVEYTLDLVDQTGSILQCKLYKGDQAEGPYPCLLK
jgi:hypothetical protein